MNMVHIAAAPSGTEQRCLRCLRKLLDIDPVTGAVFQAGIFVVQKSNGECEIQDRDARWDQLACKKAGRPTERERRAREL